MLSWAKLVGKKRKKKKRHFWGTAVSLQFLLAVEEDLWGLSGGERVGSEVESHSPSTGGIYNARAAPLGGSVCPSFPLGLTRGRQPPTSCSLCQVTNETLKSSPWLWDSSSLSSSFYPSINVKQRCFITILQLLEEWDPHALAKGKSNSCAKRLPKICARWVTCKSKQDFWFLRKNSSMESLSKKSIFVMSEGGKKPSLSLPIRTVVLNTSVGHHLLSFPFLVHFETW